MALSEPSKVDNPTADTLRQVAFFFESSRACRSAAVGAACAAKVMAPDQRSPGSAGEACQELIVRRGVEQASELRKVGRPNEQHPALAVGRFVDQLGLVASSSLIATTLPLIGANSSLTAFTDSMSPKCAVALDAWCPAWAGRPA